MCRWLTSGEHVSTRLLRADHMCQQTRPQPPHCRSEVIVRASSERWFSGAYKGSYLHVPIRPILWVIEFVVVKMLQFLVYHVRQLWVRLID